MTPEPEDPADDHDVLSYLSVAVRKRLKLENDDVSYTPMDLLSFFERLSIPLVYDVHHHRCNPDGLSVMASNGVIHVIGAVMTPPAKK